MFALKTHQAHSRCLAASFCCVSKCTPLFQDFCITKKINKKRLLMFWVQHTGLANLPLQPNRNKLFDFSRPKTEAFSLTFVNFAPSCCAIISVVAFFFPFFFCGKSDLFFRNLLLGVKSPNWRGTTWYPSVAAFEEEGLKFRKHHPCIGWFHNYLN